MIKDGNLDACFEQDYFFYDSYLIYEFFQLEFDLYFFLWIGLPPVGGRGREWSPWPRDGGRGSLAGLDSALKDILLGLESVVNSLEKGKAKTL